MLVVFFFGRSLSRAYVLQFGQEGSGEVVSFEPTLVSLNKRRVLAYRTVLQLRNGGTCLTSFDDQSAAVYGAQEPFWYPTPVPQVGEKFAVRYLPRLPENFIIMANDQRSSFGQRIRCLACEPALYKYRQARQAYLVAPANTDSRAQLLAALDEVLTCTCLTLAERQDYRRIRRQVAAGQPVAVAY
ncbi:hypothetical protein LJY25_01900 [Hymenobacter sp. BT175]|uniref:hypothetical protein n=1 Tax=Hymenobacter translucens TaxID=2886507 RepID=UPI001D0E3EA3|nr:hypothetical protein [Hymenobacter translucens]MCC2545185.1 hypothetical protein [Hymenobacter translucens]